MFDRNFLATKLGKASLASIGAMTAMIALTTPMTLPVALASESVEIAPANPATGFMLAEIA